MLPGPLRPAVLVAVLLAGASAAGGDLPHLLQLPGAAARVRYEAGSLDRAVHVRTRLQVLAHDFARWSGEPVGLGAVVLSREGWRSAGARRAYGVPERLAPGLLALPAAGDEGTVELWRRLLGGPLPPLQGHPLSGTPEAASSLAVSDLIAQVEASRVLLEGRGYRWSEAWAGGLLAHLVALGAFQRHEAERLGEIAAVFEGLSGSQGGEGALALTALQAADEAAWLWGQAQLFRGAAALLAAEGRKGIRRVLKRVNRAGGEVRRETLLAGRPEVEEELRRSFGHQGPLP